MASERIRRYEQFGREYFLWTAKHDRDLHNTHSIADIGVVWGQRTQLFYKPTPDYVAGDAIRGMYTALLQGRFLFDLLHEDRLDLDRIRGYKAILLPGIAWLSDRQCAQLRAYVDAGGSLLASFETSMFDEQGHRRTQFGLGDLFGTQPTGPLISKGGNSNPYYARIEKPHLVLDGFHDTSILPGSDHRLPVGTIDSPILTVVPGFPAYPPELSYPTQSTRMNPQSCCERSDQAGSPISLATSKERSG